MIPASVFESATRSRPFARSTSRQRSAHASDTRRPASAIVCRERVEGPDAERESRDLIAGHLERLGSKDVTAEQVWARSNEILSGAQQRAATFGLSDEEHAKFYGREAGEMALLVAAELLDQESRPYGLGPNAVTNRMFGRDRPSPLQPRGSGLGNVPHAVTSRWFGR